MEGGLNAQMKVCAVARSILAGDCEERRDTDAQATATMSYQAVAGASGTASVGRSPAAQVGSAQVRAHDKKYSADKY